MYVSSVDTGGDEERPAGESHAAEPLTPRSGATVDRRALLGGLLGAAAAGGVAGVVATELRKEDPKAAPANVDLGDAPASEIRVEPTGELVADHVQAALVDVYRRTSALAQLDDLRVAHEVVDDFPLGDGRVGTLSWLVDSAGTGAGAADIGKLEGGVVGLATGGSPTGRVGLNLGLDHHAGQQIFTMEWRVRVDQATSGSGRICFGAVSDVDGSGDTGLPDRGFYFLLDGDAKNWSCACAGGGGRTRVDTKVPVDGAFHRFRITCDGGGMVRFSIDDRKPVSISDDLPGEKDTYGQGISLVQGNGRVPAVVAVDWYYLRRELPR